MIKLISLLLFFLTTFYSFAVELTPEESDYIKQNSTVTMCVDPDWYPFETVSEKGEHEGIAADLLRLVAERTGLNLVLYKTASWDESIEASKQGKCSILSFLNQTPAREEWLIFTEPHFTDVNVFITGQNHNFIADPSLLSGETIVFPKGTAMEELVRSKYPNLKVVNTETEKDAFELVKNDGADMTMRSLIMAAYTIRKEGYFNLKVAGQLPDFTNKFRIGVLKSEHVLRDILDKGVRSISAMDREEIVNRHVYIEIESGVDYLLIFKIAGVLSLITAVSLYWTYQLKKLNRKLEIISQTDMQTGMYNRSWITQILNSEFERAVRYGRPFSVIILDLDNFKSINDGYGHQAGDSVLKDFSEIAKGGIRGCDHIGRWGGEEFLIICPETTVKDAFVVAERIRERMREFRFTTGQTHTVSGGLAEMAEGDTVDSLLTRADSELYNSKRNGRDRNSF